MRLKVGETFSNKDISRMFNVDAQRELDTVGA